MSIEKVFTQDAKTNIKKDTEVIILLFLLSCIFFWEVLVNPDKMIFSEQFSDVISYHYPSRFITSQIKKESGQSPLWNPYIFLGHPSFADPEASIFCPTNFLYLIFPTELLFGYLFLLNIFLIGVFTYFFVKTLGLDRFSSFISSIIFMFSGTVIAHVNAGHMGNIDIIMLMTASFLFLELALKKRSLFYGVLTGICIGLQFMAGNPQVTIYGLLSLSLYFLFQSFFIVRSKGKLKTIDMLKEIQELVRTSFPLFLSLIVAASLAAIQIVPTLELLQYSSRTDRVNYMTATSYSLPPQQLITFLMPEIFGTSLDDSYWGARNFWELNLYLGIMPLILVIISVITKYGSPLNDIKDAFILLFLFSISFAFGRHFFVFPIFYYIVPLFNMFTKPSVMLFVSAFSISVLSGYGVNALIKKTTKLDKKIIPLVKIASVLAILSFLAYSFAIIEKDFLIAKGIELLENRYYSFIETEHPLQYDISYYIGRIPFVYSHILQSLIIFMFTMTSITTILSLRLKEKINIRQLKAILFLIIFLDLWFFGTKYINVHDTKEIFAERIPLEFLKNDDSKFRVLDLVDGLPVFMAAKNEIESIRGYGSSYLKSYRDFMAFFFGKPYGEGVEPFIPFEKEKTYDNSEILGLLNAKYVISDEIIDNEKFEMKFNFTSPVYSMYLPTSEKRSVYVYENKDFLPRAFVVHNAKIIDGEKVLEEMDSENFDPKEIIILEKEIDKPLTNLGEFEEVEITHSSPTEILMDFELSEPGFLFLSETWYPGWKAYDNGKEVEIYKTNYFMKSVYLEEGGHDVRFVFEPISFKIGSLITKISILALVIFFILRCKILRSIVRSK